MAAKLNFLPAEIHLLPAKEPDFLNILAQLDQLFSLAFKNAVHDAFILCHYRHRLSHGPTPSPPFLNLGYRFGCWCRCWLPPGTAFPFWHVWKASKQRVTLRAGYPKVLLAQSLRCRRPSPYRQGLSSHENVFPLLLRGVMELSFQS
jgi:hypothetical protein